MTGKICPRCGIEFQRPTNRQQSLWAKQKYCSRSCARPRPQALCVEDIFDNILPEPNSGCWLWTGCTTASGYGTIVRGQKATRAHRASWQLLRGAIPDGLHVLHKCDVRCCVNPDHLWLGTHQENMDDRARKGRQSQLKGSKVGTARLTEGQVVAIYYSELTTTEAARAFGVSPSTISAIRHGQNWGHLTNAA